MKKLTVEVVLLPTEKESPFGLLPSNSLHIYSNKNQWGNPNSLLDKTAKAHHLYLIIRDNNVKIKAGDWVLCDDRVLKTDANQYLVARCEEVLESGFLDCNRDGVFDNPDNSFKIIASTDKSLNLPTLSKNFLKTYCGGNAKHMDKVIVYTDYEPNWHEGVNYGGEEFCVINGEILTTYDKKEVTYSELEVYDLLTRALKRSTAFGCYWDYEQINVEVNKLLGK